MLLTADLSVADLTTRAIVLLALAFAVLILIGWRKTARVEPKSPPSMPNSTMARRVAQPRAIEVEHIDTPAYRRPGPVRRVLALTGTGAVAVLTGVLLAIVLGYVFAATLLWLTRLLGG